MLPSFPLSLISKQPLFLHMLHVQKLLLPSPGEQNAGVLQMHCKRAEKDGVPPRWAGWGPIFLGWLAAVKIASEVMEPLPFRNSWLTEGDQGQDTQYSCQLSSMSYPCSTDSRVNYIVGENKKNEAFWIPKRTWQGDREAQRWPHPNFPVNK